MVGVAENDALAEGFGLLHGHAFEPGLRADRHETRRGNITMRRAECPVSR